MRKGNRRRCCHRTSAKFERGQAGPKAGLRRPGEQGTALCGIHSPVEPLMARIRAYVRCAVSFTAAYSRTSALYPTSLPSLVLLSIDSIRRSSKVGDPTVPDLLRLSVATLQRDRGRDRYPGKMGSVDHRSFLAFGPLQDLFRRPALGSRFGWSGSSGKR